MASPRWIAPEMRALTAWPGMQPRRACRHRICLRHGRPPWPTSRRRSGSSRPSSWPPSAPTGLATGMMRVGCHAGASGGLAGACRPATALRPLAAAARLRRGPNATGRQPRRQRRPAKRSSPAKLGGHTRLPRRPGSSCASAVGRRRPLGRASPSGLARAGRRRSRRGQRPCSCWERWTVLGARSRPTRRPCGGVWRSAQGLRTEPRACP